MEEEPKSALEVAMEKLRVQDQERGEAPPKKLTDEQKNQIAEVRSFYGSKLAEREILYADELKKAGLEEEKLREVEEAYQEDRRRMEVERDSKIVQIKE